MRLHPGCLLPSLLLLVLPLTGCGQYLAAGAVTGAAIGAATTPPRRSSLEAPWQPDANLSIDFARPRAIAAVPSRAAADTVYVPDATRLIGCVDAVQGDTAWLALTQVRRARGAPLDFPRWREPLVRVVPDADTRAQVIATNQPVVQRSIVGAMLGTLAAFIGIIVYCNRTTCMN